MEDKDKNALAAGIIGGIAGTVVAGPFGGAAGAAAAGKAAHTFTQSKPAPASSGSKGPSEPQSRA